MLFTFANYLVPKPVRLALEWADKQSWIPGTRAHFLQELERRGPQGVTLEKMLASQPTTIPHTSPSSLNMPGATEGRTVD